MFRNSTLQYLNRPVTPNLSIFNPQVSSISSILHRFTGVLLLLLLLSTCLVTNVIFNLSIFNYITTFILFKMLFIQKFCFNVSICIFSLHFFNGVRFLIWNFGYLINLQYLNLFFIFLICLFTYFLGFLA